MHAVFEQCRANRIQYTGVHGFVCIDGTRGGITFINYSIVIKNVFILIYTFSININLK